MSNILLKDRKAPSERLQAIQKASELATAIAVLVFDEEKVPKKYRFIFGDHLIDEASECYKCAKFANKLEFAQNKELRLRNQKLAMKYCMSVICDFKLLIAAMKVPGDAKWPAQYLDLAAHTFSLLEAWNKSDIARYEKLTYEKRKHEDEEYKKKQRDKVALKNFRHEFESERRYLHNQYLERKNQANIVTPINFVDTNDPVIAIEFYRTL